MKPYTNTPDKLATALNTNLTNGLTAAQVAENIERYGTNTLAKAAKVGLLKRIATALCDPMLIMLMAAVLITTGVNIALSVSGGHADYFEVVGIFAAIALCVAITVGMEGKSAKAFEKLSELNQDITVKVIRDGKTTLIHQHDLAVGDVVLIETGDKIPADGRVLESRTLCADESSLTGESEAVEKDPNAIFADEHTPVAERTNMLYSGSMITNGSGKMLVTDVGEHTEFGKIAAELSNASNETTPLQEKLAKLGKTVAVIGTSAAVLAFAVQFALYYQAGEATFANIADAFITSIVLVVAAVPEGLPAIVALSLAVSVIKMSQQNALVKKMVACETIGCVNVICSDKTGTLTENRMTVVNTLTDEWLIRNAQINSTAEISKDGESGKRIGNATECALLAVANDYAAVRAAADVVEVQPFSSESKSMSTTVRTNDDTITYIKGSPEKILALCGNTNAVKRTEEMRHYQEKSCRIIAFAHSFNNGDYIWDGFAAIADPLRCDVAQAAEDCRNAGIELKMLTGDNIITAKAIGNELDLLGEDGIAIEAREIEELTDEQLLEMLPRIRIIARSTPTAKMRVVRLLKSQGNVVAVTGDGINDAPAIKNADVGIAMGITGTEVSKEAADIVLLNDSFATIVKSIRWGRGIYDNFQRFIVFQLTVNCSALLVVLLSVFLGFGAPFTALQLLWINIIMDGPPALALGLLPIRSNVMKRKPIKRDAPIVSKQMWVRIVSVGIFITAAFMLQSTKNIIGIDESAHMPTVLFTLFALFQVFNALMCSWLGGGKISKAVLISVAAAAAMQVVIVQFAGAFFGTEPLALNVWCKIIIASLGVIVFSATFSGVGKLRKSG